MKRVLQQIVLLAVALFSFNKLAAQDLWDGISVASGFHAGTGTESDPYQIRTGAQMMYFANQINSGNDFSGKTIKLMNDIDMNRNTNTYLSISKLFAGTFDGNNHILTFQFRGNGLFPQVSGRICHFGINGTVYRSSKYPFYGGIYIVSNLEVSGVIEDCYYQISDSYLYGVTAALARVNWGTIRNCYATGRYTVYESYNSGILVYMNYGTVENCSSTIIVGNNSVNYPMVWQSSGSVVHNTNSIDELNSWVDENPSHSRWCSDGYHLVDFNPVENCTVEFIDTLFHQIVPSKTVKRGESIGTLPKLVSSCSHTGWIRGGQEVEENGIVNNNWTLFARWEQLIRKQPTAKDMSIETDDEEHASFQWYAIYGEAHQLGSWKSTNHSSNSSSSQTFNFTAKAGQVLKFKYTVSSELDCDVFNVYCNGEYKMGASGDKSGEFIYEIPEGGDYTLVLRYSKDEDTNRGTDNVVVSNICISDQDIMLSCTSKRLPAALVEKSGFYFCMITYLNTGKILSTDTIAYAHIIDITDVTTLDDAVYIEPFSARIGSDVNIAINLKNAQAASAYNFDLVLPEGVTIAKDSNGKYIDALSDRHSDHTRTFNYKGDNVYSFATLSGNSEALKGNDGAIRLVTLHVADEVAEGTYAIEIKNASYSLTDGKLLQVVNTTTSITVENYILGDVNGNDHVDIGDAVSIVNNLVGKPSSTFIEKAADTNKNGQIDIGDAVTIVNFLVGKTANLSRSTRTTMDEKEPQ